MTEREKILMREALHILKRLLEQNPHPHAVAVTVMEDAAALIKEIEKIETKIL